MKPQHVLVLCAGLLMSATSAWAQVVMPSGDLLMTGEKKLACEALLCLSSNKRPHECTSALRRYFSIKFRRKPWKTIRERKKFLKLCPASNDSPQMVSLVNAIVDAGENCEVESLNQNLAFTGCVTRAHYETVADDSGDSTSYSRHRHYYCERTVERDDKLPNYCKVYFGHEYTDFGMEGNTPVYIGKRGEGGFWTTWANKDAAEQQWQKEQARRAAIAAQVDDFCTIRRGNRVYHRCHWPTSNRD